MHVALWFLVFCLGLLNLILRHCGVLYYRMDCGRLLWLVDLKLTFVWFKDSWPFSTKVYCGLT